MTQILTTAILMVLILAGCSGKDAALDVKTSVSTTLVVPSDASSCVAVRQTTTGTAPARDIAKAYIRIPKITFTKKNPANDMYIALIKISFTTPGSTSPYVCTTSGDALSALSSDSNWWGGANSTSHDTLIPAGTNPFTTDCPLYCGGISTDFPFFTSAKMEITGYEQAPGSDIQDPVKIMYYFNVNNPP